MSTNFPGGLDTTSNLIDNATDNTLTATTHATAHNNIADAIIAVETALGINPEGSYATVAAWLAAAIITNPGAAQTITPTADAVALIVKQGGSGFTSDLQEWKNSAGSVLAFVDHSGNFSAQGFKVNGTALAASNLSNGVTGSGSVVLSASPTITGTLFTGPVSITGITGATAATRYVGATTSGHPTSGTFSTGDYVIDQSGAVWVCTAGGTSGTWANVGASGNLVTSVAGKTGAVTLATTDLSDVSAKTGSGTTLVFASGPTFSGTTTTSTLNVTGTLEISGTAIASTNLSDVNQLQRKGKIASNIAHDSDGMSVAFSTIQGVTPGTSGNTQTALQISVSGTSYTLTVTKGGALIQGTDDVAQGMYGVQQNANTTCVMGTHADPTNPRIDLIVIQYNDSYYTGRSPADSFQIIQVAGTATAGATLSNLNGAPAVPASSVLLAYVLVPAGASGVTSADIQDARILSGPAIWGEDGHRYRLAVDANGNLFIGQVS